MDWDRNGQIGRTGEGGQEERKGKTMRLSAAGVRPRLVILAFCCIFVALSDPSRAAESKIETLSLAPIPNDEIIEIQPSEDSELSEVMAATFADQLRQDGYQVGEVGNLILRFIVDIDEFDTSQQGRLSVRSEGGNKQGVKGDVEVRVGGAASAKAGKRLMKVRASLGRGGRPPLWTGYGVGPLAGTDRLTLGAALARQLAAAIGQQRRDTAPKPADE